MKNDRYDKKQRLKRQRKRLSMSEILKADHAQTFNYDMRGKYNWIYEEHG